jgi:hypothetical protein
MPFATQRPASEDCYQTIGMIREVIVLVVLSIASHAFAQTSPKKSDEGMPLGLAQKQAFADSLIEDESVARRIRESQDVEAQRLLTVAKDSYAKALAAIRNKDFTAAENQLNETLSAIGRARRLVPDTQALIAKQRSEYAMAMDRIESMQKSYMSYLKRVKLPADLSSNQETQGQANLDEMARFLEEAKVHAKAERWNDALLVLEKAEQTIKSAMGRILGLMTFEVSPRFNSPQEEYTYDLERNRSLAEMVPVAIAELKPSDDIRATIENLVEQNQAAIDLAIEYAKARDYRRALANLHAGISYLEVALTTTGLVLPQGVVGD